MCIDTYTLVNGDAAALSATLAHAVARYIRLTIELDVAVDFGIAYSLFIHRIIPHYEMSYHNCPINGLVGAVADTVICSFAN